MAEGGGGGGGGGAVAAPAAGGQAQGQPQRSWMDFARTLIFQMVIFYFISSYFRGNKTPPPEGKDADGNPLPMSGTNLFRQGQDLVCALPVCGSYHELTTVIFRNFICI